MRIGERDGDAKSGPKPQLDSEGGVGRVASVLGAFCPGLEYQSLAELTSAVGLPKATTHRYLRQMVASGLLGRTPDNRYYIARKIWEAGQLAPTARNIDTLALPHLCRLFAATNSTVHLAILDGADVLYVAKLPSLDSPAVNTRVGGRMPAYCTALGKALLAFSEPRVMNEVVAGGLPRRAPRTIVVPGILERQLQTVRKSGVAFENEESGPGVACVASVILGRSHEPVAAISIASWASRLSTSRLATIVQATATRISQELAGHDGQ